MRYVCTEGGRGNEGGGRADHSGKRYGIRGMHHSIPFHAFIPFIPLPNYF